MNQMVKIETPPTILIGSSAIKHWFHDFPREPKDTDYLIFENYHYKSTRETEYLKNKVMTDLYNGTGKEILEPNHLCTLKASHLAWDINWDKHMFDLQFLLNKGCEINEKLFHELYEYWNKYHSKNKRSDLKLSKEDFFTNAINYDTNQHDDLHKIINPYPIYETILKDGSEVELDEDKWNQLSKNNKIELIREEVYVMAYERFSKLNYRIAYSRMLRKFIQSHAPIFTLTFILKNYIELHKTNINFIKQIENE